MKLFSEGLNRKVEKVNDSLFVLYNLGGGTVGLQEQDIEEIPTSYSLAHNFPNPFNPSTTIQFKIPVESFVALKIYDVQGKEISTLINKMKQPDSYRFEFKPGNLSSGVYFYQLSSKTQGTGREFIKTRKMLFIK